MKRDGLKFYTMDIRNFICSHLGFSLGTTMLQPLSPAWEWDHSSCLGLSRRRASLAVLCSHTMSGTRFRSNRICKKEVRGSEMKLGNLVLFLYPFPIDGINGFPTHSQTIVPASSSNLSQERATFSVILHSPRPLEPSLLVSIKQRSLRFLIEQKPGKGTGSPSTSSS